MRKGKGIYDFFNNFVEKQKKELDNFIKENDLFNQKNADQLFYIILFGLIGYLFKEFSGIIPQSLIHNVDMKVALVIFALICIRELIYFRNSSIEIFKKIIQLLYILLLINSFYVMFQKHISQVQLIHQIILVVFVISLKFCLELKNPPRPPSILREKYDIPVATYEELFPTRQKEFRRVYDCVSDLNGNDPYAVAITAEWGEGKTSFVNALKQKLENNEHEIIFVQPMILDSREKLLNYVFKQLEAILNKNHIYTGKGSPFKRYFELILKFVSDKSIVGNTHKLFKFFSENKKEDLREYKVSLELNMDILYIQKKRVYIIIDDLDRVEEETIYSTLTFIKEIVDLKGIVIIFLIDYDKIISERITKEYLEKFIYYKFKLQKIRREEAFNHYLWLIIPPYKNFFINNEVRQLKNNFNEYLNKIVSQIQGKINSSTALIQKLAEKGKSIEKEEHEKNLAIKQRNHLKQKLSNPRYAKKIVMGIKESFDFIEKELNGKYANDLIKNENNGIEIHHLIQKFIIFKVVFKDDYDSLLKFPNFENYVHDNDSIIVRAFFNDKQSYSNHKLVIETRIYQFYDSIVKSDPVSFDIFKKVKDKNDTYLEKIDSNDFFMDDSWNQEDMNNLLKAINYSQNAVDSNLLINRINKFSHLAKSMFENKKMGFYELLLFLQDPQRNALAKYSTYMMEIYDLLTNNKSIEFKNSNEQKASIQCFEEIKKLTASDICKNIGTIAWLYKFDEPNSSDLINEFSSVLFLRELNKKLVEKLSIKVDSDDSNSIIYFKSIYKQLCDHISSNENKQILESFSYFDNKINRFITLIKVADKLIKRLKKLHIDIENVFDINVNLISEVDTLEKINNLHEYLKSNSNKVNHWHFRYFHEIINEIGKSKPQILDQLLMQKLGLILTILKKEYNQNYTLYDSDSWNYCLIRFVEIEKKVKVNDLIV